MVASASLLYRMGIEGDDQVKAAIAAVGTAEEQTAARAVAAADRKADRVTMVERQLAAARAASADADSKALAIITGNTTQYEAAKRRETAAEQASNRERARTTVSVGQLRAGSQQLSYQIGDVAQQFALGTPPMVIFAQQGGQVIQAIQLMSGSSKGLIGFLGGPWGAAIMGAGTVLAMLASRFLDNAEAAKRAEEGMAKFQQRQSDIGNFIDLTTGKLREQNRVLIINARLTREGQIAANEKAISDSRRQVFSAAERANRRVEGGFNEFGVALYNDPQVDAVIKGAGGDVAKLTEGIAALAKRRPELAGVAREISGIGGAAVLAQRENDKLRTELRALDGDTSALRRPAPAPAPTVRASSGGGGGSSSTRSAGGGGGGGAGASVAIDATRYARELSMIESEHLALLARMTPSIDERARIAVLRIDQDQASYAEEIAQRVKSKELTQAQGVELMSKRKSNTALQQQQAAMEFQAERLNESARLSETMSDIEEDRLRTARDFAVSAAQAREIELRLVDLQYDRERAALQNIIEMGKLNKATAAEVEAAQRRLDALPERQAADQDRARRGTMGPMESYMDQLSRDAENLNEQFESIAVRGLQSLNDGLAEAIVNGESLGDMFSNVADQIIADLLRIAIQQMIIQPLMDAMGGGGGIPGFGTLSFATGTHHFGGGAALVGERGPEMALFPRGTRIVPANDTARMMGAGAPMSLNIDASIHAPGADAAALARVEENQRQLLAQIPTIAVQAVADAQQRIRRPLGMN